MSLVAVLLSCSFLPVTILSQGSFFGSVFFDFLLRTINSLPKMLPVTTNYLQKLPIRYFFMLPKTLQCNIGVTNNNTRTIFVASLLI